MKISITQRADIQVHPLLVEVLSYPILRIYPNDEKGDRILEVTDVLYLHNSIVLVTAEQNFEISTGDMLNLNTEDQVPAVYVNGYIKSEGGHTLNIKFVIAPSTEEIDQYLVQQEKELKSKNNDGSKLQQEPVKEKKTRGTRKKVEDKTECAESTKAAPKAASKTKAAPKAASKTKAAPKAASKTKATTAPKAASKTKATTAPKAASKTKTKE